MHAKRSNLIPARAKAWLRTFATRFARIPLIAFVVGLPLFGFGQKPVALDTYKDKWPDEDAVFLKLFKNIDIAIDGRELDITTSYDEQMLFMSDNAGVYADRSLGYSSFREILEIDARTLVPESKNMKSLPVNEIRETDPMDGSVFVDDYKEKSFVFPGVKPGAIAELKYREKVKEPRFLGAFYFNSYIPVEASSLTITADEGVSLKYILLGGADEMVAFSQDTKKGRTTYNWQSKQLDAMTYEEGAPALNNYEPHIVVYIDEIAHKDGSKEQILSDVSSLYGWYRGLTRELNTAQDPELAAIVDGLVAEAGTDEEKVSIIFNWVQDNIRYIAFEEGLGGFVPREASKVCSKKYGDCKDMASLTTEMLEYAGIQGNLTWIGTRDIPYSYEDVPTPIVDNHMIASVELNGERIFLDATDDQVAFGYPTSFIQGKQALVGMGDEFKLIPVPEVGRTKNRIEHQVNLTIEDGVLQGPVTSRLVGYPRFNTMRRLADVREERRDIFFKNSFNLGNNKAGLSEINVRGTESRTPDMSVDYILEVPDYAKSIGEEIYINLNLNKRLQHEQIDVDKRTRDREFEFKYTSSSEVTLEIPEGYKVDYLPENASFSGGAFGFDQFYSQEGNTIVFKSTVYVDCLLLEKDNFNRWNEMINALDAAYQEVVVLVVAE